MSEKKYHPKLELAVTLNAQGRFREAIEALHEGLVAQPDFAGGWWLLGGLYCDLGEYSEAIPYSRRAVELRPASEKYSKGLFHALLDAGWANDVVAEARRFLAEVEKGAKCSEETRSLYTKYARDGVELVARWKRHQNS